MCLISPLTGSVWLISGLFLFPPSPLIVVLSHTCGPHVPSVRSLKGEAEEEVRE